MSDTIHPIVIIGSGAAGLTAAIYAGRADMKPLLFAGIQPGGQLTITTEVENYPGFEHGIMGPDLMDVMTKQAQRFGTEIRYSMVEKVDFASSPKKLFLDDDTVVLAHAVIVATGASAKYLGLESEQHLSGYGVSACATCDGFFFKDRPIAVVGGGDTAMEEASYLAKMCSEVVLIHRRDSFRASAVMQERVLSNPKVKVRWNSEVLEVLGTRETGVSGLKLRDTVTGELSEMATQGLFLAIGHTPNTKFLAGTGVTLDADGYIDVHHGCQTNVPGLFAAGDVRDRHYRQAISAAGMGCMAALEAERYISAL
jgi:thioredoxin reductase (NADPH)